MDSVRQTRKKGTAQATSFQPSKTTKDKQPQQDDQAATNPKASPKENPTEKENLQEPQPDSKSDKSTDKSQKNDAALSENASDLPRGSENPEAMIIEEPLKAPSIKSRDILYGDDASEETKKQIESLFETAQSFAAKEDYNQAINTYTKVVKLNEKSTAAWIAMGHCFAMLDDNYRALQSYQQALNITPECQKDDQLWYGIGLLYQKIEDWKNAETSFRNALKLNPSPTLKGEILYHLGVIMKVKGDHQEGIKMLTNSILLGSFSVERMVDILCNIGTGLEELNETNEALQTYKYALMLDENNYRALQCLGWLYFQMDKTTEALEHLNKAALLNDDDPNTHYMKGRCYLKLSQHNKAYECLHKCITKDSSNSTYWSSLGILFSELTQFKQAHECFSNALKFNARNADNYFNMGCLFELCSQWNDALTMYDKAIELHPTFTLAQTRRQGVLNQIENKNPSLEVQFKHHKFILSFAKDIDKEKPLFFFPQATQAFAVPSSAQNHTATPLASESNATGDIKEEESKAAAAADGQGIQVVQLPSPIQAQQQTAASAASIPTFQPVIPQISGTLLGNLGGQQQTGSKSFNPPSTTPKGAQDSFMPKPLVSPKPNISQQSQGSLFSNLNVLQAMKQNIANPGMLSLLGTPKSNQSLNLNPSTVSTDQTRDETGSEKGGERKASGGFITSAKTPSEGVVDQGGFRKSAPSPIVLRHDQSMGGGQKEEDQKSRGPDSTKSQKTGFKLTQKLNRGEEGLIPQKKVKLEKTEGSDSPPDEQKAKKTQSLVLRPSPLNN